MDRKLKLAVCQLRTELEPRQTMDKAARMVREAAANGAQAVVLPEMFNCPYSREYFLRFGPLGHEAALEEMSGWAKESGVLLVGGSVPELADGRLYNTCFIFDETGRQIARHRKVRAVGLGVFHTPQRAHIQRAIRIHISQKTRQRAGFSRNAGVAERIPHRKRG